MAIPADAIYHNGLWYDRSGALIGSSDGGAGVVTIPGFIPSIFPALAVGATYEQNGTLVTVTCVAHGLPNSLPDEHQVYWPGAAALPAGWYPDFKYVGVDTFTFEAPNSATIAPGTAITGTLPATEANLASVVIPSGMMGNGKFIKGIISRSGGVPGSKTFKAMLNGNLLFSSAISSSPTVITKFNGACGPDGQIAVTPTTPEGSAGGTAALAFIILDYNVDNVLLFQLTLNTASSYCLVEGISVTIS